MLYKKLGNFNGLANIIDSKMVKRTTLSCGYLLLQNAFVSAARMTLSDSAKRLSKPMKMDGQFQDKISKAKCDLIIIIYYSSGASSKIVLKENGSNF
jgi:hypothetical protein